MKRKIVAIFLVSILLVVSTTYSFAVTSSELRQQQKDLENQQKETKADLGEVKIELSNTLKNIQNLDAAIADKQDEINGLNNEIKELQNDIAAKEKDIDKKQEELEETDELLQERLVAMYQAGETSYLDVLFSSEGLTDFISKYYYLTQIAKCDTELMEKIDREKTDIENEKKQIEKNKEKIENNKRDVQSKQNELKTQKASRETEAAKLNREEKELQAEMDKVNKQLEEMEKEILRVAAEEAKKNQGGFKYTGGKLEWPCPSYSRISSYFGSRGSPLAGGSSYHKGIDIAASNGNSIIAAEAGQVIKVVNSCSHNYGKKRSCGCGGGYGNYVMINHGGGLVTIYGHCSSINVSNGQRVARGQKIASVGSTGASTGFHLHFGTALNGTYVNPMQYLQ